MKLSSRFFANLRDSLTFSALCDSFMWPISVPTALFIRLIDSQTTQMSYSYALVLGLIGGFVHFSFGVISGLYRGGFKYASFDEIQNVTTIVLIVAVIPVFIGLSNRAPLPRSVGFIAGLLALTFVFTSRFIFRVVQSFRRTRLSGIPTLIYGAGELGQQLGLLMLKDLNCVYYPVGFVDDNPYKRNLKIHKMKVLGDFQSVEALVNKLRIELLVIAITNIEKEKISQLQSLCSQKNVELRIVPSVSFFYQSPPSLENLLDVTEEDVLGRRQLNVDHELVLNFLKGKKILITGAGGSIGSEIARQVSRYSPARVAKLDRDETLLQNLQLSLDGRGLLNSDELILADLRDYARINEIVLREKPDVIFHAAALKHLSLLEMYPDEGYKTNVLATRNLLAVAASASVPVFINISTDKAVEPTSVLGRTKLEAEFLTKSTEIKYQGIKQRYLSVRFGNVLGSRGSVLETFRFQIKKGGPLTLTDHDVTRYFMTIAEAVHLVLEAAAIGDNGEVLVLEMGKPVKIHDLAKKLISMSGKPIKIEITGLRA